MLTGSLDLIIHFHSQCVHDNAGEMDLRTINNSSLPSTNINLILKTVSIVHKQVTLSIL